jgi:hypothetical protein
MYETRRMLQMLEQMKPAQTFLKSTFFGGTPRTFDTEYVDIDIMKGKRRMAPFISPIIGGKTVERQGYTTNTYKPPLIGPDMITTSEDLMKRSAGENVYGAMSPDERAAEQLGRDIAELDTMITRREEWMCAQALFTGTLTMTGEGVSQSVNFGLTHTDTPTNKWSAANGDPLADLKKYRKAILQDAGVQANICVMGSLAADAFLNNAAVQKLLNLLKVDIGQINPTLLPNGVTYLGRINAIGLDIYTYDEWYLDDNGTEQPMVPEKQILLGSTAARTDMLYGAVVDVNRGTFAAPRVPKSWTQEKPSARFVQIMSRPLPVPTQIDGFYVGTILS